MLLGTYLLATDGVCHEIAYYGNFPPAFWQLTTCCMPHALYAVAVASRRSF